MKDPGLENIVKTGKSGSSKSKNASETEPSKGKKSTEPKSFPARGKSSGTNKGS